MKFPLNPPALKFIPNSKTVSLDSLLQLCNGLIDASQGDSVLYRVRVEDTFEEFNDLRETSDQYGLVLKADPDGGRPHAVWAYIGPKEPTFPASSTIGSNSCRPPYETRPGAINLHRRKADDED